MSFDDRRSIVRSERNTAHPFLSLSPFFTVLSISFVRSFVRFVRFFFSRYISLKSNSQLSACMLVGLLSFQFIRIISLLSNLPFVRCLSVHSLRSHTRRSPFRLRPVCRLSSVRWHQSSNRFIDRPLRSSFHLSAFNQTFVI